jgi:hypothetical protein
MLAFSEEFDAVISLCQGAFGLAAGGPHLARIDAPITPAGLLADATDPDPDARVLDGMAQALRVGGRLAVSAFSAYFQVRWLEETDSFDADAGVNHERTALRSPLGDEATHDLWTTCFTPRELRLLATRSGLEVRKIWSVTPGEYARRPPDLDHPEFLMVAIRPPS